MSLAIMSQVAVKYVMFFFLYEKYLYIVKSKTSHMFDNGIKELFSNRVAKISPLNNLLHISLCFK